jgi:hypothetical protein
MVAKNRDASLVKSLPQPSPTFALGRQIRQIGDALAGEAALKGDGWDEVVVQVERDLPLGRLVAVRILATSSATSGETPLSHRPLSFLRHRDWRKSVAVRMPSGSPIR